MQNEHNAHGDCWHLSVSTAEHVQEGLKCLTMEMLPTHHSRCPARMSERGHIRPTPCCYDHWVSERLTGFTTASEPNEITVMYHLPVLPFFQVKCSSRGQFCLDMLATCLDRELFIAVSRRCLSGGRHCRYRWLVIADARVLLSRIFDTTGSPTGAADVARVQLSSGAS